MAGEKLTGDVRPYATEVDVISLIDKLYGMKVSYSLKQQSIFWKTNSITRSDHPCIWVGIAQLVGVHDFQNIGNENFWLTEMDAPVAIPPLLLWHACKSIAIDNLTNMPPIFHFRYFTQLYDGNGLSESRRLSLYVISFKRGIPLSANKYEIESFPEQIISLTNKEDNFNISWQ